METSDSLKEWLRMYIIRRIEELDTYDPRTDQYYYDMEAEAAQHELRRLVEELEKRK